MSLRIPLPGDFGEALERGTRTGSNLLDAFMKKRMLPIEEELKRSQAKEHASKASQAEMISRLLNQYISGASGSGAPNILNQGSAMQLPGSGLINQNQSDGNVNQYPGMETQQGNQQQGDFGKLLVSGLLGLPTHQMEGNVVTPFGLVKAGESPTEKRAAEHKIKFQEQLSGNDLKQLEEWNKYNTTTAEIKPALEAIHKISADPIFQNMYKNPEYFGKDIDWLTRFGKPEEIKLLSQFAANQKSLYTSTSQEFKGAFRKFERDLFDKALPDEHDTLQAITAKTQAVMKLRNLVSDRFAKADEIYRTTEGAISPANALKIAEKQIGEKEQTEKIERQYNQFLKEQKNQKVKDSGKNNAPDEVRIYDPKGNRIGTASRENADKFLKAHQGYYAKDIANG